MNQIFKLDGPVFTFLNRCCDVLLLSILWIIFSFPIITIGSSSAALYHSVHKVIFKEEGYLFSTFWRSFRSSLKQGILLTLLCALLGSFCAVSYFFSIGLPDGNLLRPLYFGISIFAALLTALLVTYSFPVLSRFYMTFSELLKTSVALAVTRLGFSLLLIMILLLCLTAVYLAPFTAFFLPALYMVAAERLLEPAFRKALDAREKAESSADKES